MSNSKANRRLREIEVSGTPYEMGFQYGAVCPEIGKMLDLTYEGLHLERNAAIALAGKYVSRHLPFIEAYAPDIVDEMKGIAEGAKVEFGEILFLNLFHEVSLPGLGGCTSFAAVGEATSNGEIIIGQNLDFPPGWGEMVVLLKMKPTEGPSVLAITVAGIVGMQGVNSAGLALNANLVVHKDFMSPTGGIPITTLFRKVLSSESTGKAIGAIASARMETAINLLLGSREGDLVDIEVVPNDLNFLYPQRGLLVHANHFETDRFKSADMMGIIHSDSYIRSHRLVTLMGRYWGKLSVDVMKELLQDHNNHPDSICRHVETEAPPIHCMKTLASIISYPKEHKMYITLGNPCENEYIEYKL